MLPPFTQKSYWFPSPVTMVSPCTLYESTFSSFVVDVMLQLQPPLPSSVHVAVFPPDWISDWSTVHPPAGCAHTAGTFSFALPVAVYVRFTCPAAKTPRAVTVADVSLTAMP